LNNYTTYIYIGIVILKWFKLLFSSQILLEWCGCSSSKAVVEISSPAYILLIQLAADYIISCQHLIVDH